MTNQLNNIYQQLHNNWILKTMHNLSANSFFQILTFFISLIIITIAIALLIDYFVKDGLSKSGFFNTIIVSYIGIIIVSLIFMYFYNQTIVNNAIGNQRNEIKNETYQTTVINYKKQFETNKWLYNANVVYTQNIGNNKGNTNDKLAKEISNQNNRLDNIKNNLKKLSYLDTVAGFKQNYTTAKQLYPEVSTTDNNTIKPSQLSDKQLQADIKKSINEK